MGLLKVAQSFLLKSSQFILQNGKYVSLLLFLLPDKESKTYEKPFLHILSECNKINITFSQKRVFADFEKTIH